MRYNEFFDFYDLKVGDFVRLVYKPEPALKISSGSPRIRSSQITEPKYLISAGRDKKLGAYIELTDGFDQGYKRNSLIVMISRLQRIEVISSFGQQTNSA